MAISLVVSTSHAVSGTTTAIDTTGANLIVITVSSQGVQAPTDNKGNTWVALTLQQTAEPYDAHIYYCATPSVGAGHTFSTAGATYNFFTVQAFSGADSTPFDVENGATASNAVLSSLATGSVSPSVDGCVIVAVVTAINSGLYTINSSFTIVAQTPWVPGANIGGAGAYLIQTTKGAVNPTWTWTATGNNGQAAAIAVFKPAAVAAPVGRCFVVPQAINRASRF